jgi:molybdenum cofactor cytidylyltransferase
MESMHQTPTAPRSHACRVGAVLLAAGSASRMGGKPKCLLQWNGQSLIQRQITALRLAGVNRVVVVLGHYADAIAPVLQNMPVQCVHNPHPEQGQASSLRIGLAALVQDGAKVCEATLVGLADQPLIGADEITALLAAHQTRPAGCEFTQPWVDGLPGNPVVFTAQVRQTLLAASGEWGGREWQKSHPAQVYRWATPHAHYRIDLDSPADLQAFTLRTGRELEWPPEPGAR